MGTALPATVVTQLLRRLPAGLVRLLDAWSFRRARRRQEQRRQAWVRRQAATPR